MIAITPELVKARQLELIEAADRSRRGGRRATPSLSVVPGLVAVARAARLRLRRDTELVPGPFAPCAAC